MNDNVDGKDRPPDESNARQILHDSPVPVIVRAAKDGSVLYYNPVFLEVTGLSDEAVRTRDRASFYVNLAEREYLIRQLEAAGRARDVPVTLRRPDSSLFTARMWASKTRYQNQDAEQYWITDIAEQIADRSPVAGENTWRKRAEEELRVRMDMFQSVFENVPIAMTMKARDGRYMHVNRQFADWFGRSIDQVVGNTAFDLFERDTALKVTVADRRVLESGEPLKRDFEVTFQNGEIRYLFEVKFPIRNVNGVYDTVCVAAIDMTDQHRLENELRQSQKMEAIGQLTGGIAHDFNNMLSVVLGNLELIEEMIEPDDELYSLVETAINGAERGANLNKQLLAFSRRAFLAPRPCDLNQHVMGMVDMIRRALGERVEVEAIPASELWPCEADPVQVEAALLNLALNARDAMPDGGKLIIETANAELTDEYAAAQAEVTPGEYVMLAVSDTGHGMSSETLDRVFEPFFTTKEENKGSGLGLSMVFGFAKQSNGHITIYSEVDEGTTVRLYLPRTGQSVTETYKPSEEMPLARKGETVLVVEDDDDVRGVAVTILRELGYHVLDAEDGDSALTRLASAPRVDLLLTDVVLPGELNGPGIVKSAVGYFPEIKTLYMSGYTENAIVHQGRLDDGVLLLPKPFRKVELAQKVRQALEQTD